MAAFMPHGHCIYWNPTLLGLHVISDFIIFLSYCTIPAAIWYYLKKKKVSMVAIPALFILFIFSCAITHVFTIWNWWHADYWASGSFKALCAMVSATTAVSLWVLMPKILKLPTVEEVSLLNENLKNEVVEKDRAYQALKEQKDLNKEQTNYLASVAHEIRNHLNIIEGGASVISADNMNESQAFVSMIQNNAIGLNRLLSDVLDIAKMDSGTLEVHRGAFNLNAFLDEIANSYREKIKDKNLKFIFDKSSELPHSVVSDELRLRQILLNLLSNASKYTEKGHVKLAVDTRKEADKNITLIFRVEDTGAGIPKEDQGRIFEYFTRSKVHGKIQGVGIGLALSKQLAQVLGGDIELVKSDSEGTVFQLEVLVQSAVDVEKRAQYDMQRDIDWSSYKVLMADDSVENLILYGAYLKNTKVKFDQASNGQEAFEKCKQTEYDVIILDIEMPNMNGLEAMQLIKAFKPEQNIIAATGHESAKYTQGLIDQGFDSVIVKPMTKQEFLQNLSIFLES